MSMHVTRAEFLGIDKMDTDELREYAEELLDENERLRELRDCTECAHALGAYVDSIADPLKAENARLCELCAVLVECGRTYHCMAGACPLFDADSPDLCSARDELRELGIEVDE